MAVLLDQEAALQLSRRECGVGVVVLGNVECSVPQPLQAGIPFPRGQLHAPVVFDLADSTGATVPVQTEVLSRWPDDSVKWLLLDVVPRQIAASQTSWRLERRDAVLPTTQAVLSCVQTPEGVVVDTGSAVFTFRAKSSALLSQVCRSGQNMLAGEGLSAILRESRDRVCRMNVKGIAVEVHGPVRATVRVEGQFYSRAACRFVARLCFFAGTGLVRLRLTVHNPRRARHRGGLWDLGDQGSILFRELALHLQTTLESKAPAPVTWLAEPQQQPSTGHGSLEIYQDSSGGTNWRSRNHVDRTGNIPCLFRGYRVRQGDGETQGLRANPVVALHSPCGTITAAIPEFWQQFPKAIEITHGQLRLGLFPRQFQGLYELQGGEQKTHAIWLHFGPSNENGTESLTWVHQPARFMAAPEWYASSGAVPYLATEPALDERLETLLAGAIEGADCLQARRETIDEYGWRNYGDLHADHEGAYYAGPAPVISHYNNQYDVLFGTLLHYLRTGNDRWLDIADPLARHIIDIDVYHTDQDKSSFNGGLFWHTDHYRDAATSTHRSYSRTNKKAGVPYGGGPGNTHNYTSGLLLHYFTTGNPLAHEAVLSLANWVISMDDGRQHVLGWIEPGPTGSATHNGEPKYVGPGRGSGNSVNGLLDAWVLTQDRKYLDKAEEFIRRVIHPADDLAGRDLLNVEPRWSYTVFLTVLARYLGLKRECGDLGYMYAYARASLLHYAGWMAKHEKTHFEQVEKLEFPTETWAAHDFRKANVMRSAVPYADEPLGSLLSKRADEIGERAWSDLMKFPSRTVVRSLAIMMQEGAKDTYHRSRLPASAPLPSERFEFGQPETFVYQKERIAAGLRSWMGVTRIVLRLLDPRNWGMLRYLR